MPTSPRDTSRVVASRTVSDEALIEIAQAAERFARMACAWRDQVVATAHAEGVRRRRVEAAGSGPEDEIEEWAHRDIDAELATALRIPEQTLASRVGLTQELITDFPRVNAAYSRGEVSAQHVTAIVEVFSGCEREVVARADHEFASRAASLTASRVRAQARRWRARHTDVDQARHRASRAMADRHVRLQPTDDGMSWLHALLPSAQAHGMFNRLTDIASKVTGSDEKRTMTQLRADVLTSLVLDDDARQAAYLPAPGSRRPDEVASLGRHGARERGMDEANGTDARESATRDAGQREDEHRRRPDHRSPGDDERPELRSATPEDSAQPPDWLRGLRPTVVLTVPALSLLGHDGGPAILEGNHPIDIDTARQLAAHAPSFIRVLTHPETGAVLSVGRDRYVPPSDLRTALRLRDVTCRFPGCGRRAERCDLDHSIPWAAGGRTDIDNLAHLCRKHHRLKHHSNWQVRQEGGGRLRWTSPAGQVLTGEPATEIWPPPPVPVPVARRDSGTGSLDHTTRDRSDPHGGRGAEECAPSSGGPPF